VRFGGAAFCCLSRSGALWQQDRRRIATSFRGGGVSVLNETIRKAVYYMRFISRSALVAFVVVFAMIAMAAASASAALPEFNHAKTEKFQGSFGTTIFEEVSGSIWDYEPATISGGEVTGSKEVGNLVITFTGGSAGACSNQGEKKELVTNKLHGRLGYINKAKTEVGLLLESPSGQAIVQCKNSKFGEEWYAGSVIGRITPVNKPTSEFTLEFKQTHGIQELRKFEGEEVLHSLEFDGATTMGLEGTAHLKNFKINEASVLMEVKG
jgi:hypothetical protein